MRRQLLTSGFYLDTQVSVFLDTHMHTQQWKSPQPKMKSQGPLMGEGRWQVRILQDQHCGSLKRVLCEDAK